MTTFRLSVLYVFYKLSTAVDNLIAQLNQFDLRRKTNSFSAQLAFKFVVLQIHLHSKTGVNSQFMQ